MRITGTVYCQFLQNYIEENTHCLSGRFYQRIVTLHPPLDVHCRLECNTLSWFKDCTNNTHTKLTRLHEAYPSTFAHPRALIWRSEWLPFPLCYQLQFRPSREIRIEDCYERPVHHWYYGGHARRVISSTLNDNAARTSDVGSTWTNSALYYY